MSEKKKGTKKEKKEKKERVSFSSKKKVVDDVYELSDLDRLLKVLDLNTDKKACLKAAKGLYHLTDVDHKSNRTVVASHSPEILGILCNCVQNVLLPDIRHLGLLICNNLSIPLESKLILNQSPHAREIYNTCLNVIDTDPREAYLGSICLMNLSFLASAVPAMLVAGSGDNDHKAKTALLPVLSRVLRHGKSEAARWCCGLLKNISRVREGADRICETDLPSILFSFIEIEDSDSETLSTTWVNNSTEDFALYILLNIVHCKTMDQSMCADIIENTTPLTSDRGIQGLKAILITGILGGDVQPAEAARVSELVVSVTNRVGKQGEYTFGVFNLTTALTAMASLATSSRISESPKYMNAIARPDALAALFQIVADQIIVLSASFEETKEKPPGMSPADDTPEDMVSMAISTLLALSPSIFRATPGDVEADTDTVKIKAELHSMILTFEKNSSAGSQTNMDADHFMSAIKQSGNGPMPILAQAHKLWIAKRQQDGVDYCSVFTETAVEVDEKGPLDFLPCAGWGNNNTKNEKGDVKCVIS